jgi:eukaryotic-like serine/threonine-protein kinase
VKEHRKYRAFISYSHADRKWGSWLHRSLEKYRTPKNLNLSKAGDELPLLRMTPVFRDHEELSSSPDLSERINSALSNSECLIVICSPNSAKSRWVDQEITAFKELGRSEQVFCLIVAGDPRVPGAENDCFPPSLRIRFNDAGNQVDGDVEPIAADAREEADGKKLALLKLIAGIQGVNLDDLRQRDLQRRNQRLAVIAVSSLFATTITITLAISAVIARDDAVLARNDADQRREQAEGLISFMLGDLRERLQPVGRLDVLDGVGEQALAYFSSLSELELTSTALLTRATALRQIGEVRVAQGLISDGLVAFNEAQELLENSSTENEAVRLFELGQINYWIADAYFNNLQLGEAQSYILKYLEISRELAQLEPDNPDYQLELLYAEINLGTLAFRANNLTESRSFFDNALTIGESITKTFPGSDIDEVMSAVYSWLGAVDAAAGNFSSSLDWYEQHLTLRRELFATSETPPRKHRVGRALFRLADIQAQVGQSSAAISALAESIRVYRELVAYDPLNYEWQREFSWALTMLARESYGDGSNATGEPRALLALASEAFARISEEQNAENSRISAAIDIELGRIELLEGNADTALLLAQRAKQQLAAFIGEEDRSRIASLYGRASYIATEAILHTENVVESRNTAESALAEIDLRRGDPLELQAYAALLAFRAQDPIADELLANIAQTEYKAVIYIPNTEVALWWNRGNDQ